MMQFFGALAPDDTGGVVLEDLFDGGAEMVMQGSAFEETHMLSAFLEVLVDGGLENDRDALHEEDAAEDGDE